jgi:hypothetical protein
MNRPRGLKADVLEWLATERALSEAATTLNRARVTRDLAKAKLRARAARER